jgi:hypothetical protein
LLNPVETGTAKIRRDGENAKTLSPPFLKERPSMRSPHFAKSCQYTLWIRLLLKKTAKRKDFSKSQGWV